MNNKRITYEEAVKRLKEFHITQKHRKRQSKLGFGPKYKSIIQKDVASNKKEINLLLSIVAERKAANKLYEEVRLLKEKFGD